MIKILILLFSIFSAVFGVYPQYVMLYQENNCFGQNYQYTFDTKENLTEPWSNALSAKFRGAWAMVTQYIADPEQRGYIFTVDGDASMCLGLTNDIYSVASVTKLLDVDLETSAISLMPDFADFSSAINILNAEHQFEEPRTFGTVVITGVVDYTLFEGVNFNGTSFCAEADHYSDDYFGATNVYNPSGSFTVGSLRLGNCRERENKITEPELVKSFAKKDERRTIRTDSGFKVSVPVNGDNFSILAKTA